MYREISNGNWVLVASIQYRDRRTGELTATYCISSGRLATSQRGGSASESTSRPESAGAPLIFWCGSLQVRSDSRSLRSARILHGRLMEFTFSGRLSCGDSPPCTQKMSFATRAAIGRQSNTCAGFNQALGQGFIMRQRWATNGRLSDAYVGHLKPACGRKCPQFLPLRRSVANIDNIRLQAGHSGHDSGLWIHTRCMRFQCVELPGTLRYCDAAYDCVRTRRSVEGAARCRRAARSARRTSSRTPRRSRRATSQALTHGCRGSGTHCTTHDADAEKVCGRGGDSHGPGMLRHCSRVHKPTLQQTLQSSPSWHVL